MDALEFAKELRRMCMSSGGCKNCPALGCACNVCDLETLLPIVEKWSAEHPKVTNLDHHAEELEKLGYKVDKKTLRNTCPPHKSKLFAEDVCYEGTSHCRRCSKWWDEEYKESKE